MNAMLGKTEQDEMGKLLGTGYHRFKAHCGMNGLAKEDGRILYILALDSTTPGKGQCRKFIELAKKNYVMIVVLEVWNDVLKGALERYGFIPTTVTDKNGITNEGMMWIHK